MATNGSLTEPFGFRRNLFTEESGSPMKFSMRPCEERTRLRPVIEHGGGILTSKSSSGTIRLAEPGCRVLSENCYSTRYVWECAMTNHLLAMQDYKAQQNRPVEGSDISETDSFVSRGVRVSQRKIRGRREYYVGDDQAILDFIIKTRRHAEIKGTALWKDMERRKVLQGRTWQSLKERFLKQILPSISSYSLSLDEIRRFRVPFSNEKERYVSEDNCSTDDEVNEGFMVSNGSGTEDENLRKPQKYLTNEDMAIIRYILQDGDNLSLVSGNNLWKEMGFTKVTSHSWQSMKERFHKRILPNIGSYKIPQKYQKRLQQLIAAFPATAGALNIGNIKKEYVPVEEYESPGSSSCSGVPGSLVNHCEESPASNTEREQLQDSVNEEHRAVEADTESNCSHDSRRVKPRKRMRLLSSSTDGLVEEGKNPATKQKNSGKYSETSRTKRLKRKKESNHVRVTRNSAANISASSHSSPDEHYDKNNELLREASPKNYDEDQLSQSIVVEELNSFQLDIPAVDTQIPSKEMCNPRGHALARRKRKARKSDKISSNVPVSENSDIVTLSDDTELYVSDSEAVVNAAAVLGNEMPNNANMSHECNLRLQTELQLCLELKLTEVDKLLKENHFNWNLALSKIFVETSDSEEM